MLFAKGTKVQGWVGPSIAVATLALVLLFANGTAAQGWVGIGIAVLTLAVVLIGLAFLRDKS